MSKVFFIDEIKPLLHQYREGELSISKLTELLNEKVESVSEPIKERKQEWDWLGWLQERIPELKKSQNVFWLKQCVNDLLSQSQPYKKLSEGEKKELSEISDEDLKERIK